MSARDELTEYTDSSFTEFGRQVIQGHLDRYRNEVLLEAISLARTSADAADVLGQEREATVAYHVAGRLQGLIKEAS